MHVYPQYRPFWLNYIVYHKYVSSQKSHRVEVNIRVQYQHYFSEFLENTGAKPELYDTIFSTQLGTRPNLAPVIENEIRKSKLKKN